MAKSKQQKNALKYIFLSASIIISMFDLHAVHLKCFCSFMCPLNVFQTYIKNVNRKLFPRGQDTDGHTENPPPMSRFPSGARQKGVLITGTIRNRGRGELRTILSQEQLLHTSSWVYLDFH